uniref:Uncharacterized protein n=1 Tax=viral metagenome TaxID=1070528 RepID=A0A6C0K6J5_9ZZZZ
MDTIGISPEQSGIMRDFQHIWIQYFWGFYGAHGVYIPS